MKNLFGLIFLALLSSAIYGCKKEESTAQKGTTLPPSGSVNNADAKTKALLLGKWTMEADTLIETSNGVQVQFVVFKVPTNGSWFEEFDANGGWTRTASTIETATYTLKNSVINFVHPPLNGVPGYEQKAYIRSVSSNKLAIYYKDTVVTSKGNTSIVYEAYHYKR